MLLQFYKCIGESFILSVLFLTVNCTLKIFLKWLIFNIDILRIFYAESLDMKLKYRNLHTKYCHNFYHATKKKCF